MDFFYNPFSSPVGQRIEKSTSEDQGSDLLVVQLEICDIINETEEGAQDAVKALRKRLFGNKNWVIVLNALAILEICVKNCGHRFHILITKKEFVDQLVTLTRPKTAAPSSVQERVLGLLQTWADSFRGRLELDAVCSAYDELRRQGVEFPAQDLDTLAPIFTPSRSVPQNESQGTTQAALETHTDASQTGHVNPAIDTQQTTQGSSGMSSGQQQQQQQQQPAAYIPMAMPAAVVAPQHVHIPAVPAVSNDVEPLVSSPTSIAKLRSELDMVQRNASVLCEMLQCLTPGEEATADYELLTSLGETCRDMQSRIYQLLSTQQQEELIGDLLTANDVLNSSFTEYESYQSARSMIVSQASPTATTTSAAATTTASSQQPAQAGHLINLDSPDASLSPAAATGTSAGLIGGQDDDITARLGQMGIEPPGYMAMAGAGSSTVSASGAVTSTTASSTARTSTTTAAAAAAAAGGGAAGEDEFDMFAARRQEAFATPSNMYEMPAESSSSLANRFGTYNTSTQSAYGFDASRDLSSTALASATAQPQATPAAQQGAATISPPVAAVAAVTASETEEVSSADAPQAPAAAAAAMQSSDSESVSQWLASNDLTADMEIIDDKAVDEVEPMTTEEFDMFLSARTSKSKKSNVVKTPADSNEKKPARRARRMMQKADDDENEGLFAL
ncbi:target of Myb1 membrane trafficking protein-like [Sycon ciliatum]|uniref:target of Myb1 membrane trafficking protein-like n=1 Tax=Sycon ciliatum TaxID=27933 RepID=UPI0031F63AD6